MGQTLKEFNLHHVILKSHGSMLSISNTCTQFICLNQYLSNLDKILIFECSIFFIFQTKMKYLILTLSLFGKFSKSNICDTLKCKNAFLHPNGLKSCGKTVVEGL